MNEGRGSRRATQRAVALKVYVSVLLDGIDSIIQRQMLFTKGGDATLTDFRDEMAAQLSSRIEHGKVKSGTVQTGDVPKKQKKDNAKVGPASNYPRKKDLGRKAKRRLAVAEFWKRIKANPGDSTNGRPRVLTDGRSNSNLSGKPDRQARLTEKRIAERPLRGSAKYTIGGGLPSLGKKR